MCGKRTAVTTKTKAQAQAKKSNTRNKGKRDTPDFGKKDTDEKTVNAVKELKVNESPVNATETETEKEDEVMEVQLQEIKTVPRKKKVKARKQDRLEQ